MKQLLIIVASLPIMLFGQTCNLDLEDFTGASNANPPLGWIKGMNTNIANTFDNDPEGICVGFNTVGETMTSPIYNCVGQVCFDHRSSGNSSVFDVELSTIQPSTQDTLLLSTIIFDGTGTQNQYQQVCFDIDSSLFIAPFDMRLHWEMTSRNGGTYYFDNVCVTAGTCIVQPTEFKFTNVPPGCIQKNTSVDITVCAVDFNGFIAETYTDNITVSINTGVGNISGTTSGNAVDGCFVASISFDSESSYELLANSSSGNGFVGLSPTLLVQSECPQEDTLRIISYNLLNYPNGRNDCGPNTVVPARWDTLANIMTYVQPDIIMVCELQNEIGADSILNRALNVNGVSHYAAANFVANQSSVVTNLNNMMFYNTNKVTLQSQSEILTSTRDFNKYVIYANDPSLALHNDTVFVDLYMAHLKAGSASIDSTRRATDCLTLRNYLDNAGTERNNVLGGDLNFYTDQEQAYQTLISGVYPFVDPVGMEGAWDGDPTFASVHTQSSREPGAPNYDCGFGGGADSRFDFLLTSESIINNTMGASYLTNSLMPLGNDGSIYNKAINDPSNTSGVPSDVLNSLYHMSDHLPVVMDIKITYPLANQNCGIVTNINDVGPGSLRQVISCVSSGDTVFFDPSLTEMPILILSDKLLVDKDITIYGDPSLSIIVSNDNPLIPSLFEIEEGHIVTFENIKLIGGSADLGSCILNKGDLTLKGVQTQANVLNSQLSTVLNMSTGQLIIDSSTTTLD